MAERPATFLIKFPDASTAAANRAALELKSLIESQLGAGAPVTIRRSRDDTQDLGTTLTLVLGTPSVMLLAQAVRNYITKRGDRVVITTDSGKVVATGSAAANIDAAATAEALRAELPPHPKPELDERRP